MAVVGCLGCRDRGDGAARTRDLALCVDAIDRAPAARPEHRLDLLARGCAPACPGLATWADLRAAAAGAPAAAEQRRRWTDPSAAEPGPRMSAATVALLEGCRAMCSPQAELTALRTAPAERWAALLGACGPGALGLDESQAYLASEAWLILHRINGWLEAMRRSAVDDPQLPAQLERATRRAYFRLPLPARHRGAGYQLAASDRGRATDAVVYVLVTAGELRVGTVPLARLRGPDLELRPAPGGAFPGVRVTDAQAGQAARDQAGYVEREIPGAAELAPLVVADAATPLARVVEVVFAVGAPRIEVAVAADVALAHPVAVERQTPESAAVPVIRIAADHLEILGLSDDRTTAWDHLADELRHFAAVNAPVRKVGLEPAAPATAADLVRILDACAEAHVAALVVAPPP